ncbi:hypothetical protein TNCV_1403501 [Trichonephila clavipes]|nr:hypothetical protein TNCV_1403501 [Trichonephila clavipes]
MLPLTPTHRRLRLEWCQVRETELQRNGTRSSLATNSDSISTVRTIVFVCGDPVVNASILFLLYSDTPLPQLYNPQPNNGTPLKFTRHIGDMLQESSNHCGVSWKGSWRINSCPYQRVLLTPQMRREDCCGWSRKIPGSETFDVHGRNTSKRMNNIRKISARLDCPVVKNRENSLQ